MNETTVVIILAVLALAAVALRLRGSLVLGRRASAVLLAVTLALAFFGATFIRPAQAPRPVDVLLVDLSRSMGADPSRILAAAVRAWPNADDGARAIVVAAGTNAVVVQEAAERPQAFAAPDAVRGKTFRAGVDWSRALATAAGRLSPGEGARLVVFTDGGFDPNAGVVPADLPILASDVRPLVTDVADDVGVRITTPPQSLFEGDHATLDVRVFGSVAAPRNVLVRVGGVTRTALVAPGLPPDHVSFDVIADGANGSVWKVAIDGPPDADSTNDTDRSPYVLRRKTTAVGVLSGDPDGARPAVARLSATGVVNARIVDPATFTNAAGWDVILVHDLAARDAARTRAIGEQLSAHASAGGGVVFVGVASAFARGDWEDTAFDRLSPLKAKPGAPPLDVIACIDRSGSMDAGQRFDLARRAVRALYEKLSPGDVLECLAFATDVRAFRFAAGDPAQKVDDALGALAAEGGTRLGEVLDRALAAPPDPEKTSLILLLTDGRSDAGDLSTERVRNWCARAKALNRPIFVFWFDRDETLRPPLDLLARETGGALVPVDDFGTLVQPFLHATRPDPVVPDAEITAIDGARTRVKTLLRTRREDGAEALRQLDKDTLALAVIARGAGRVAAAPVALDDFLGFFANDAAAAAFVASLAGAGVEGDAEVLVVKDESGFRFRVRTSSAATARPTAIEIGGRTVPLRMTGLFVFESTAMPDPPEAGEAILHLGTEKLRRPFAAPDLSDRTPEPSASGRADLADRLTAAARSASVESAARRLDLIRLAAVLMLMVDIALRALRR